VELPCGDWKEHQMKNRQLYAATAKQPMENSGDLILIRLYLSIAFQEISTRWYFDL